MSTHATLFITHRGLFHQQEALEVAPSELQITMVRSPSREQVLALLPGQEFLISERTGIIDQEMIQAGKDLRLIQRLGSQTYDIDLEAARRAGIPVCYLPVRNCIMVAEHMMMQMLGLSKRVNEMREVMLSADTFGKEPTRCTEDVFAYNWSGRTEIRSLWRSTVGILGMGEIGFELARRLQNFGCKLLYNKRSPLPERAERELQIQYAARDELVASSDFLCVLLPLFMKETEQSLDREFFARMKPGACFVSAGGSGIIDEQALAAAIASGRLYGAAVDNYTWEPVRPDCPLLEPARREGANVILTPHVAAGTLPAIDKDLRNDDYQNLIRSINGQSLVFRLV
ncbi:MAG TPA: NAD(P)-dependent oxidoreductase [Anaerolineales bacterium]|nr:NAD(P)-dependent oxidoreductase [Anaerolineales bacterium]